GHPARHPDFAPGNVEHVTHGARSPRIVEERAASMRTGLLDVAPWLDCPEYAMATARFLRAEARALLLHSWIVEVSKTQGVGKVAVRLWEQVTAADRLAAQLGNVLGLDPLGLARLRQATAGSVLAESSLAGLAAEGRAARERAAIRLAGVVDVEVEAP
ncbi:MAG: hypothetical protein ACRDYC_00750, partial [Acidimicrobiales bacterium]